MFYQDTLELVRLLLSVFLATAFDIAREGGDVYRHHAEFFWGAARGERTEGHPRYVPNLSAFLWARRLNSTLSTRLHKSLSEQDSKLVHC
ncbi:hypothetical protein BO443_50431 [Burkholderia orbicola]